MPDNIDRQPLLDTQQNQLGALLNHSASIDAKALGLLATTAAILIFVGQAKLNLEWWHLVALFVPYIASLVFNLAAVYPRRYVPNSIYIDEHPEYLVMDKETLVLQLLSDTAKAIETNEKLNIVRLRQLSRAFVYALLGVLVLLLLLGLQ